MGLPKGIINARRSKCCRHYSQKCDRGDQMEWSCEKYCLMPTLDINSTYFPASIRILKYDTKCIEVVILVWTYLHLDWGCKSQTKTKLASIHRLSAFSVTRTVTPLAVTKVTAVNSWWTENWRTPSQYRPKADIVGCRREGERSTTPWRRCSQEIFASERISSFHLFKCDDSAECPSYKGQTDEAEHVFFVCPRFSLLRSDLEEIFQQTMQPNTLVEAISSSKAAWNVTRIFCHEDLQYLHSIEKRGVTKTKNVLPKMKGQQLNTLPVEKCLTVVSVVNRKF